MLATSRVGWLSVREAICASEGGASSRIFCGARFRFETLFESAGGLTRRRDPGYLRCGEKRETTLIQSGGGPGPAKPQQPAREGAVLIPTRATLESGPRKMRIARW